MSFVILNSPQRQVGLVLSLALNSLPFFCTNKVCYERVVFFSQSQENDTRLRIISKVR